MNLMNVKSMQQGATTFGSCTRNVASLSCIQDRKPNVFGRSVPRSRASLQSAVAPHGTLKHRGKKKGTQPIR
ncbi:MAG: hypothetical protein AMJ62_16190 [Myxococcales bacterium SG8_38]|nr:MAG: hypothetical protein AMJ62_16190 [Myxococcales bacterium SG8_38]